MISVLVSIIIGALLFWWRHKVEDLDNRKAQLVGSIVGGVLGCIAGFCIAFFLGQCLPAQWVITKTVKLESFSVEQKPVYVFFTGQGDGKMYLFRLAGSLGTVKKIRDGWATINEESEQDVTAQIIVVEVQPHVWWHWVVAMPIHPYSTRYDFYVPKGTLRQLQEFS